MKVENRKWKIENKYNYRAAFQKELICQTPLPGRGAGPARHAPTLKLRRSKPKRSAGEG
jgi:hypothetical protein